MKCTHCSAEIAAAGRFCPRCGTPVSYAAQSQQGTPAGYTQAQAAQPGYPPGTPDAAGRQRGVGRGLGPPPAASAPNGWAADPYARARSGHAAARGGGGSAWIFAGILALAGAAVILAACFLPYAHFVECTGCKATSPSLIRPGGSQASEYWYAVEPLGVLVLAVVCGILLFAVRVRRAAVVAAAMLLAFGIQTVLLFAGYQFSFTGTGSHAGSAGAVGMLGGLVLIAAAAFGLAANSAVGRAG